MTTMQYVALALTDDALADRLDKIVGRPRFFNKAEKNAFLAEAAHRLRHGRKIEQRSVADVIDEHLASIPPLIEDGLPPGAGPRHRIR